MSSGHLRVGLATFALALGLRLLNVSFSAIAPADELYHWKRIEFSAQHFPQVLELDRDRGVAGVFCPWPPLYDVSAGLIARIFGMNSVPFISPVAGAVAVALASMWVFARFGSLAGCTAAIALAFSPFIVTQSWVAAIDHHFLEWPLVFAIVASLSAIRYPRSKLALAMCSALFVQSALIIACGLAFIVLWCREERRAAAAFFTTAAVVAIYRATRSPGYPDSAWFLGWPHVILLVGAGVALIIRPRMLGLAAGVAIAACAPVVQGLHFFGGDRWLQSIVEFQPMWKSPPADLLAQVIGLGAGAILVWKKRLPVSFFAMAFLILTIINRRFWSISIPLLAIAGAIAVASITSLRLRRLAAAFVAFIPVLQLIAWMRYPQRAIERYQQAWIDAAKCMRTLPPGRVLAPWSMGHTFDVLGRHGVIVDGFGTMPDEETFWRASDAMRARDAATLAKYCDANHVRYIAWYDLAPHPRFAIAPPFRVIYRSDPSFMRAVVTIVEYRGSA